MMKKHITFELYDYTKFIDTYSTTDWEHVLEWHEQLVAAGYPSAKWNTIKGMPSLSPKEFTMFVLKWS